MENFSDLGTARAVGRETLWPETYGESRDSQSPLRACSACAGDYEDPDRRAWTPDEEEEDLPVEMAQEKAENDDEFPAQEV
jgi:hypothetical protein